MSKSLVKRGFTLVELLVVIGVIALLIAILMPALTAARQQARSMACKSNLRQIHMALTYYAADNDGWIRKPSGHKSIDYPAKSIQPYPVWADYLCYNSDTHVRGTIKEYLPDSNIFVCKSAPPRPPSGGVRWMTYGLNSRMFGYNTTQPPRWISIEKNGGRTSTFGANNGVDLQYYRLSATRQPSEMWLVADSTFASSGPLNNIDDDISWWPREKTHKTYANMLYHDGHVGQVNNVECQRIKDAGLRNYMPWRNERKN